MKTIAIFTVKVKGKIRTLLVEEGLKRENSTVQCGTIMNRLGKDYGDANVSLINLIEIESTYSFREAISEKAIFGSAK